ncbi:PDZ domain-containing protein [bacterium]|nr:PDZ domain-containing protein [bacterium]
MKNSIKNTFFAIATIAIATLVTGIAASECQAQDAEVRIQAPANVPTVAPPLSQEFYFGMHVQIHRIAYGRKTLEVVSVTPGSPAHQAGLEVGDRIRTVNGQGFRHARNSFDAVRLLNQHTIFNVITVPAHASAHHISHAHPKGYANLTVRNVRNGRNVTVIVRPKLKGGFGGSAPAAAAIVAR